MFLSQPRPTVLIMLSFQLGPRRLDLLLHVPIPWIYPRPEAAHPHTRAGPAGHHAARHKRTSLGLGLHTLYASLAVWLEIIPESAKSTDRG